MKIAIIENYSCKCSYQGRHRDSGEWNDLYFVEHSYIYTFYSDSKEIPIEKYKVIDTYLKQFNKSSNETQEYYTKEDTHQMFDIEKSNFLAKVLNCQTFEPGILPLNIFQHKIHQKNIYIKNNANLYKEEIIADVSAILTLPVLKYLKLTKEDKYWKGINSHSNIYIDENNNLCCVGRYNVFKISIVLADFIYIPYKTHDKSPFGNIGSSYAIIIKDDLYGVINLEGEIIIKYQKYKINEIYNNFCIVEHNKYYSCMNFDGKILMPFTIQKFSIYYDRYAEIMYDNFKFLYDLQYSKFILNANYKDLILVDKNLIFVKNFNGFVDIYNHDSLKINNDFLEHVNFCDNSVIICKIKLGWIIYDWNGDVIFLDKENKYTSIDITDDEIRNIQLKQKKANNYFRFKTTLAEKFACN